MAVLGFVVEYDCVVFMVFQGCCGSVVEYDCVVFMIYHGYCGISCGISLCCLHDMSWQLWDLLWNMIVLSS